MAHRVLIARRVFQLRRRIEVDSQQMRLRTIGQLEQLFDMASSFARGEHEKEMVDGKTESITMKQRQMWARIAAYIAQVMTTVTEKFDEREIDKELNELERLIDEASAKHKVSGTEEEGQEEQGPA